MPGAARRAGAGWLRPFPSAADALDSLWFRFSKPEGQSCFGSCWEAVLGACDTSLPLSLFFGPVTFVNHYSLGVLNCLCTLSHKHG